MLVKATREGLIGQITALGWTIDAQYPFVALPSHKALGCGSACAIRPLGSTAVRR